ncbi:N-acetylgalactosamine-N, N'-diacetylbacillosaminyl-diphospho-undecaprenol 4-alpha-N-acetylgalactosaminyltransferase [Prolinoborus fasciculus]|nr:N-acetylgalactosamine-N, N'-diacetylbacillosaminyl-diphospho-undecaprenol 4-alpha-N-acetylgalactosaminyltransferase [Prolinoborus fasciculus]
MVHANILTRLIRLSTPIKKLICTAHNSNEGSFLRMALYRITHNLADLTTNVSNTAVYSFEKKKAVPKNTMRTVYNGINFTRFKYSSVAKQELFNELNLKDNTKIILAVGRLNQQKNYPNLLRAIKLLNDKYTEPFMLLIAGDGELRLYIEKLINELNLNNFVLLLGRRSDIPKLMSACDVFVLSSDYEGLPTVLIEALACQAHTVSTDVSGAAEVLKDNGVIVPINNPEELFKAIEALLKKNYKNSLGFKYAYETFDLQIISEKWLNIYNEN